MNQHSENEQATMGDVLGLDTWNRTRTSEELRAFIESRHENLSEVADVL